MMTKIAAAMLFAIGGIALAGCQGGAQQTGIEATGAAASLTEITLSPADLAQIKATCVAAEPALATATSPGAPGNVADVAIYPKGYCDQLLAGTLPMTTNGATPVWLPTVLGYVKDAAQIAGMVLPLALPLL